MTDNVYIDSITHKKKRNIDKGEITYNSIKQTFYYNETICLKNEKENVQI